MKTILLAFCLAAFLAPAVLIASPPGDGYHVMWNTLKGKERCFNTKTQGKADRCADKLRSRTKATASM
jgi:hypothetical protein